MTRTPTASPVSERPAPSGRDHAVVIGGSLGGLLAARALSAHFTRVTIVERDAVHDQPEARKGQPQTRHLHGLLASGFGVMSDFFPGLADDLAAGGAMTGDFGERFHWYSFGGYRVLTQVGLSGTYVSRPFLEWQVRRRVLALPNVTLLDQTAVEGLIATADRTRVAGLKVVRRGAEKRREQLAADLVVDASGRGSPLARWLAELGYPAPPEELVKTDIAYATREYRRIPTPEPDGYMVSPEAPHEFRFGGAFPVEGERWIVMLGGWHGDHPPLDEAGFTEFARSLPAPDVYNLIRSSAPLTGIVPHKFPGSLRRRYEALDRFPAGLLALGDAVASFNPVYGQGMSVAALEAQALDRMLAAHAGALDGLWRPFFQAVGAIVDLPWKMAVGEDFRYPQTEGKKARETDFINAYVARVHRAAQRDAVVYRQFAQVMNLLAPPETLMAPRILWRALLFGGRRAQPSAPVFVPVTADRVTG
jgi:flavin-dependent dehydrogenase